MGPSALELPILVLARVVPRALLSERLVARNELVRCNTDGDEAADDAQDHIFVRRTVASRGKEISSCCCTFGRRLPDARLGQDF